MCTVTWHRNGDGYVLLMNRDELWSRGEAEPPRELERQGMPVLAPIDSDAGGTWLAVNAAGVTLCLLNRYPRGETGWAPPSERATPQSLEPRESRGMIVLRYAAMHRADAVPAALAQADLRPFAPFTLLSVDPRSEPSVCRWDGYRLETSRATPPVSSSSFGGEEVVAARSDAYRDMVEPRPDLDRLFAYHRSHRPDRGPYSVCAHRDDGGSRSLSVVEVDDTTITLTYEPGPPCETGPTFTATLRARTRG